MLNRTVKVAAVQAEPVWGDLDGGIDKSIGLIEEAASNGAEIVGFPETFVPGYPWHIWLDSPAANMGYVPGYVASSPTVDGPQLQRIGAAAAKNEVTVILGYSQRRGGSLYMSQATFTPDGTLVQNRNKLKPTHVERSVFGEGDGSDLDVVEMPYGNIGSLCCWEHLQPLSKYAMYSMDEDIHCAAWPSFSLYKGAANALGAEVNNAASMMYAVEGSNFVIAPCSVTGEAAQSFFCDTDTKKQMLQVGGGFAKIYGPDGTSLAEPIPEDEEGILYADCEPALQAISKSVADPAGHYSRPDVTSLLFNRSAQPTVSDRVPTESVDIIDIDMEEV